MHKHLLTALVGMVALAALLTIGQIWGPLMDWDLYGKIIVTLGILVLLSGFLLVVKADLGQHKKLKDENYLD
jgi:ribose/xylose/arabinose/galactoside ABC-type transport system permease subunit